MRRLAQLVVRPTEVVGASKQVHPSLQRFQAASCVATFARQAGQSLPHGSIQPLDKSSVEHVSSERLREQPLGLFQRSLGHPPDHFHHVLLLGPLDDRGNADLRTGLQTGSPTVFFTFSRNAW